MPEVNLPITIVKNVQFLLVKSVVHFQYDRVKRSSNYLKRSLYTRAFIAICMHGEKLNGAVLPTGKVAEKWDAFRAITLFLCLPECLESTLLFCIYALLPCSSMKHATVTVGNETVLSSGMFSNGTHLNRCIVFVKKLYCSICWKILIVFSTQMKSARCLKKWLFP